MVCFGVLALEEAEELRRLLEIGTCCDTGVLYSTRLVTKSNCGSFLLSFSLRRFNVRMCWPVGSLQVNKSGCIVGLVFQTVSSSRIRRGNSKGNLGQLDNFRPAQ